MRDHLIDCFKNKELTLFPSKRRKILNNEHKLEMINIIILHLPVAKHR